MFVKHIATGLAASALLTGVAFAQTPETSYKGDWRTSKVVGLNVYNDRNESIGSINDLLTDKSGSIKAAVISVGGFLGVGSRLVAVPFDKVKFVNEPVAYSGASGTGAPGGPGTSSNRPPSSTTTGSSTSNAPAAANNAKPNPWYPDHAVFNADKDQLKGMPEFKYSTE